MIATNTNSCMLGSSRKPYRMVNSNDQLPVWRRHSAPSAITAASSSTLPANV